MNLNKNYIKNRICIKRKTHIDSLITADGFNTTDTGAIKNYIEPSYYINVFLTKTCEIFEYVDVKKDDKIYKIDKQLINPYYIDFGFFNSAKRIKVNTKDDLTPKMIDYLNNKYKTSISNYKDVFSWFDEIGYNILINDITTTVDDVTGRKNEENGLEKLEKLELTLSSVVSKAFYFPIEINK